MDGRVGGSNLTGRKMRIWPESGTTLLENGMETLMTKVNSQFGVCASCMYC